VYKVTTSIIVWGLVWLGSIHRTDAASPWIVQTDDDGAMVASLMLDHINQNNPNIIAVFNVGFAAKTHCQGEIGTALLSGAGYGQPVGRVDPSKTDIMVMRVDSNSEWAVHPFIVKYQNGWEALFNATDVLLAQLQLGSVAYSRIVPDSPTIEFPLAGAASAIDEARTTCLARLGHQ
jgi:hypothetical protein